MTPLTVEEVVERIKKAPTKVTRAYFIVRPNGADQLAVPVLHA